MRRRFLSESIRKTAVNSLINRSGTLRERFRVGGGCDTLGEEELMGLNFHFCVASEVGSTPATFPQSKEQTPNTRKWIG
jgi:hypothetical protein